MNLWFSIVALAFWATTCLPSGIWASDLPGTPAAGVVRPADAPAASVFEPANLMAWCIVPFDASKRGPEERARMLTRLGFRHFAYDWRAEHIPTFDAEVEAMQRHGISLERVVVSSQFGQHRPNDPAGFGTPPGQSPALGNSGRSGAAI
ncbi:MAG: hypothetical protein AB9869_16220 [Verrucomicrobiia bacterium]